MFLASLENYCGECGSPSPWVVQILLKIFSLSWPLSKSKQWVLPWSVPHGRSLRDLTNSGLFCLWRFWLTPVFPTFQDQSNLHRELCLPLLTTEIVLSFSMSHRGSRRYDGRPSWSPSLPSIILLKIMLCLVSVRSPRTGDFLGSGLLHTAASRNYPEERTVSGGDFFFEWTDLSVALRVFRVPGSWRHPVWVHSGLFCILSFCLDAASALLRFTQRHLRLRASTSSGPSTKMCKLVWVKHLSQKQKLSCDMRPINFVSCTAPIILERTNLTLEHLQLSGSVHTFDTNAGI